MKVTDITKYDVVVSKPGYLDYRVTDIEVEKGKKVELDEYKLIAGNVVLYDRNSVTTPGPGSEIGSGANSGDDSGEGSETEKVVVEEIEVDDLVALSNNIMTVITESNKDEKGLYDFNEDGKVDGKDRRILKTNYGRKAETVKWEKKS